VDTRGVDLNVFEFDYDLTWAAFFLNGHEKILGRFGGRDEGHAEAHLSLRGLKYAMERALAAHKASPDARPSEPWRPARTVEDYPAARRIERADCIHCHQIYDFRREALKAEGRWSLDEVWVYPPPKNVGIELDPNQGDLVRAVAAGSAAGRAGLAARDRLLTVGGIPVASFADLQYALHLAPRTGELPVVFERSGERRMGRFPLDDGWRRSDISWRGSMWGLEPSGAVHGAMLTAEEKQALGLPPRRFAFRHARHLTKEAREAGIREGDVILGIDGKTFDFTTVGQFKAYIRLNQKTGDRVAFNVIRDGKRIEVPMTLPARASW